MKTDEQNKAWAEKMRTLREAKKKAAEATNTVEAPAEVAAEAQVKEDIAPEQGTDEILRQLKELQESNALLKAAFFNQSAPASPGGVSIGARGVLGEVEKYLVDPSNYPDPTERLVKEDRLKSIAFDYNYELDYSVAVSSYENKGINYKEPKFLVQLNRIVVNDQGEQTPKRYIARRLIFHEDPQAALVIARENGIEVDRTNEKQFLDEMRYLRVRDWLFDIFWAKPSNPTSELKEEVVGGTIVQVFTKSSEAPAVIDFDKITRMI